MSVNSANFKSADRNTHTGRSFDASASHTEASSDTYRYKKTTQSAILSKTNIPAQDGIVIIAQGPPVGTYNVRTNRNISDVLSFLHRALTDVIY